MARLSDLGYEPVGASNLLSRHAVFAGTDEERLAGFHALAADPTIGAIVFARGGYGLTRVLGGIDWQLLAQRPRAYVGYSDVTPFLGLVVDRLGLVAFHGPMVAKDFAEDLSADEIDGFTRALAGELPETLPLGELVVPGAAEGRLVGGCLSLLAASVGTPFASDLSGAVLFWEDIDEPAYRLDRMLTHLWLSGSLTDVHGTVGGVMAQAEADAAAAEAGWLAIRETLERLGRPAALGLPSGHCRPNLTLPLGATVRLRPDRSVLAVVAPPISR